MEIRKLKECEIDYIMKIWLESTIESHPFIEEKYWKKNYDIVKDIYIPMAETFVFCNEKEINGFISIINDEFIGALFIDTKSQGLGIGGSLLKYVKNRYKNINLAVYKENNKAVEFYKKHGLKIIKEQNNEDSGFVEYLMSYNSR